MGKDVQMKLSNDVLAELNMLLMAFVLGMVLKASYDCVRLFRVIIRHNCIFMAIEDIAFFCLTGMISFGTILNGNYGIVRGFIIVAIVLGSILYDRTFGNTVFKILEKCLKKAQKSINILLKNAVKKVKIICTYKKPKG